MTEQLGALPTGTRVTDFTIERPIGAPGRFGITYRALDALGQRLALKEYFPAELARRDGTTVLPRRSDETGVFKWGLRGFLDEAEALVRLQHPNLVRGLRAFEHQGTGYFAMEYVEGEGFGELLAREGRMAELRLRAFLMPLLDGVAHAHGAGLVHRDICPASILVALEGRPVLADFAGARNVLRFRSRAVSLVFTPGYAPIEEYQVTGKQGPWTDIYSLGAVAYRAITGQAPPAAPERQKGALMVPAAEAGRDRYPQAFLAAIDWALRLEPAARPQKLDDWQAALAGERAVPEAIETAPTVATAAPIEPAPNAAAATQPQAMRVRASGMPVAEAPASQGRRPGAVLWSGVAAAGIIAAVALLVDGEAPAPAPLPAADPDLASLEADDGYAAPAPDDAQRPRAARVQAASLNPESDLTDLDRLALKLIRQEQEAQARAAREAAEAQRRLEQEQAAPPPEDAPRGASRTALPVATATEVASLAPALAQKTAADCDIHVSQLSATGTLDYESAKQLRGAVYSQDSGVVRLAPMETEDGRRLVFEVLPDGCARIARTLDR